ncbi:MAG: twin-arginine translocase TatA/TatE family subunit [Nitrospira sp.]|nr:twin-arginine translocase TatA/TatE family subunit [Nitrospira sp.]MDE0405502.1 twin-arginine translocase TatA/TatE family subunit [Nitrospira sp.]MDE0486362.1 twin-arginine translocase TatA/TatE family subunit [Nitrospira sp.]
MFGSLGFTELILILFIVLIIFGAGKLPQLGEGVGKAIKGFKKSVNEAEAVDLEAQNIADQQAQAQVSPQGADAAPSPTTAVQSDQTVSPVQTTQPEPAETPKS